MQVLVDFQAHLCGACHMVASIIKELSPKMGLRLAYATGLAEPISMMVTISSACKLDE